MTDTPISPLRRRMIEDMTVRKFTARTQEGYIRAVKGFSAFLGASPATASAEDLRRYGLHLVESGVGAVVDGNLDRQIRIAPRHLRDDERHPDPQPQTRNIEAKQTSNRALHGPHLFRSFLDCR